MKSLALITGASSGIGWATASLFARSGRSVALLARRVERLEALAAELRGRSPDVEVISLGCDVADERSVRQRVEEIEEKGPIEVVVNAAGHGRGHGPVGKADTAAWRDLIDVNLLGSMFVAAACVPRMRQRDRGHIINIGSVFALSTAQDWAAYAAAKHGLRAFTQSLRQELANTRLRVSIVHPGSVNTEFGPVASGAKPDPYPLEAWPYRPLLPAQVAEAVMWVASQPPEVEVSELVIRPNAEKQLA